MRSSQIHSATGMVHTEGSGEAMHSESGVLGSPSTSGRFWFPTIELTLDG